MSLAIHLILAKLVKLSAITDQKICSSSLYIVKYTLQLFYSK